MWAAVARRRAKIFAFVGSLYAPTFAMTDEQSFEDIAFLLNLYPAVNSAAAFQCGNGSAHIAFRCNSFESLKAISSCCVAANLNIHIGSPNSVWGEPKHSDDLRLTISIAEDWTAESPPSRSQIFGISLARDLKAKGLMDEEKSHALQIGWNAVPL